jgi:inosine-uridine nucleoside N-ribohydrolase
MELVRQGMEIYLAKRKSGKAFHDPLAAAVALDESVCTFREVEVYRERGAWGSRTANGTATTISVSVDRTRFLDVLTATGTAITPGTAARSPASPPTCGLNPPRPPAPAASTPTG